MKPQKFYSNKNTGGRKSPNRIKILNNIEVKSQKLKQQGFTLQDIVCAKNRYTK